MQVRRKRCWLDPWFGKSPWRREQQPTPVFMPGESHGQRSLVGYSPWGFKESDMTERLNNTTRRGRDAVLSKNLASDSDPGAGGISPHRASLCRVRNLCSTQTLLGPKEMSLEKQQLCKPVGFRFRRPKGIGYRKPALKGLIRRLSLIYQSRKLLVTIQNWQTKEEQCTLII